MALPKLDTPVYELELPLSKKKIKFRPFLVKEQRNLLMALEANDSETVKTNIKNVLASCTLSDDIDIEHLPVTDVEFYFLNLRARSVGEVVENSYKCNNEVEIDKVCGNIMDVKVNLLDISIEMPEGVNDTIRITDKITLKLKYPEFSVMEKINADSSIEEFAFKMIADSIEYIHDGEQFYYAKESSPEELLDFVESLNQQQFDKLQEFFEKLPRLRTKVDFKCNKCGYDHSMDVEGLESFFV
jgi:hypothetical protein